MGKWVELSVEFRRESINININIINDIFISCQWNSNEIRITWNAAEELFPIGLDIRGVFFIVKS